MMRMLRRHNDAAKTNVEGGGTSDNEDSMRNKYKKRRERAKQDKKNIYTNVYKDTSRRFSGIWHLLLVWKGSVFKLVWQDLLIFCVAYTLLSILYRTILFNNPSHREMFEIVCIYCSRFSPLIPISFLTGFYVTQVVTRWWDQFISLPWMDQVALKLVSYVPGKDPFRKNLRRTVMRYVNLSTILVYRLVSNKVLKRFPTYQSLVTARLMLPHEVARLEKADSRTLHEATFIPLLWAVKLVQRARTEGKIVLDPPIFVAVINSIDYIEQCNRKILNYGWVNFPLAYTQVATLSVFAYFFAALFGRQYLVPREGSGLDTTTFPDINITFSSTAPFSAHIPDFYVPVFTLIELLSYMGWIKVAETLLNPFGEDDEDFQVNFMIDRNLQVSYLIVDEAEEELEMAEDPFLEAGLSIPIDLPAYKNRSAKAPDLTRVTSFQSDTTPESGKNSLSKGSKSLLARFGGGGGSPTKQKGGKRVAWSNGKLASSNNNSNEVFGGLENPACVGDDGEVDSSVKGSNGVTRDELSENHLSTSVVASKRVLK